MRRFLLIGSILLHCVCGQANASIDTLLGKWVDVSDSTSTIVLSRQQEEYVAKSFDNQSLHGTVTFQYKDGKWMVTSRNDRWVATRREAEPGNRDILAGFWKIAASGGTCDASVSTASGGYIFTVNEPGQPPEELARYQNGLLILRRMGSSRAQTYRRAGPGEKPSKRDVFLWMQRESLNRLRQLGMACRMYAQDHGERFPAFVPLAGFQKAVRPYCKDGSVFKDPLMGQSYLLNKSLSSKSEGSMSDPSSTVVAFEASPFPDSTRGILLGDGHCERILEKDWGAIKNNGYVRVRTWPR